MILQDVHDSHIQHRMTFMIKMKEFYHNQLHFFLCELTFSKRLRVPEATEIKLQEKPYEEESGQREGVN